MNLTQGLKRSIRCRPDKLATVCGDRRRTYRELGDRVQRMAGALRANGVENGEPVAILALTTDQYYEAILSIPWAGGVLVPVNIRWNVEEIIYSLDETEVKTLLVDDQFLPLVEDIRNKSKSVSNFILMGEKPAPDGISSCEELMASTAPIADAERSGDDLLGIFYTGGTTGFPKGVMLSHNNLMINALGIYAEGFLQGKDITLLNTLPLFHISGLLFCNICTMTGDTQVFLPTFDPTTTLQTIQAEKITDLPLVPVMIQMTVDHPDFENYDTSSLRRLYYAGSLISEAVLQRTLSRLPNVELNQVYGMTELSPVCTVWNTNSTSVRMRPRDGFAPPVGRPVSLSSKLSTPRTMKSRAARLAKSS